MTNLPVKIYYRDTDCGGVVYYANYLDYFERARTEYMSERGVDVRSLAENGVNFIVRSARLDYLHPARYGDIREVGVRLESLRGASLNFTYLVRCPASDRDIVTGETLLACIDPGLRPRRIPGEVAARLSQEAGKCG